MIKWNVRVRKKMQDIEDACKNLLPKLDHGRCCVFKVTLVNGIISSLEFHAGICGKQQEALDCCSGSMHFWSEFMLTCITCVPGVVAGWPRQIPGEGEGQIKYSPGQNYDIVEVQQSHNHLSGVSDAYSRERPIVSRITSWSF